MKSLKVPVCPGCTQTGLQKIIYGMPGDDFDFDKNIVGGCIESDFDIGCKNCGWMGFRKHVARSTNEA